MWRNNILPDYAAQLIMTDPHSPGMFVVMHRSPIQMHGMRHLI